jgi:diguanylate cyclase (GGDEF)-like protein
MDSDLHTQLDRSCDPDRVRGALIAARRRYLERPGEAREVAVDCYEHARTLEDDALCARALALQGAVSLHRGDLRGAVELLVEAERHAELGDDLPARAEVATLKSLVGFFTGSYAEALSDAERAVQLADESGEQTLRIQVRRGTCIVFGNLALRDLRGRLDELLELTAAAGDRWEEAISRNDLACFHQENGDLEAAERAIDDALEVAHSITGENAFALAVIHSTRADIRLLAGRAEEALVDAERAVAMFNAAGEPNPYVLGVTIRAEVQARLALGQLDEARRSGEDALAWLGDRVPQTRSLILSTLADGLRAAGRLEQAYDALARSSTIEREAFRELSELQLRLERATLEAIAARRESDALREQAERDWLTGLHNRRYLARKLEHLRHGISIPFSLAVLDLDHFKSINDRFGHAVGDQVLIRVAGVLCEVLRDSDTVVRSGGEEFLVLMPGTDERAAAACCERIAAAIQRESWDQIAAGLTLTTSVGVSSARDHKDIEALMQLADERLYTAKRAGRDRIVSFYSGGAVREGL